MINFNKLNVNILSVLISSIIFISIFFIIKYSIKNETKYEKLTFSKENNETNIISEPNNISEIKKWTLQIKAINLEANIMQMDNDTPDDNYIGHFKDSNIMGNNIALIAYNYGKKNNYFANIKEIGLGEEIVYTVNETKRTYKVISNKIIEKTSLKSIIKVNNNYEQYLKLFTYIKDLDSKIRYICAKEIIDR